MVNSFIISAVIIYSIDKLLFPVPIILSFTLILEWPIHSSALWFSCQLSLKYCSDTFNALKRHALLLHPYCPSSVNVCTKWSPSYHNQFITIGTVLQLLVSQLLSMNIFFTFLLKFNNSLYLSWGFQLNVGCLRASSLLLALAFHVVAAALFLSVGLAAIMASVAACMIVWVICLCLFPYFLFVSLPCWDCLASVCLIGTAFS